MNIRKTLGTLSLAAILSLTVVGCGDDNNDNPTPTFTQVKDLPTADKADKIKTALTAYADYAIKSYQDAKKGAEDLKTAIDAFTATPTEATLTAAKDAWLVSRESYGITEIMRFQDTPIDAEEGFAATFGAPEGQLNAWPLNEALIDTIVDSSNTGSTNNIINNPDAAFETFTGQLGDAVNFGEAGDQVIDTTTINVAMLREFTEKDGDANVATGYHAVEFLLWGQDQDYVSFQADSITNGPTATGERPVTDYSDGSPAAARRATFLKVATELIISDLDDMINAWTTGGFKLAFIGEGSNAITQDEALKNIFSGMGVFIKSEVANERFAVAILTPSEEDEHSCFSDNTHRDLTLNYDGFMNVLNIFKTNLSPVGKAEITALDTKIDARMVTINNAVATEHFDYQILATSANHQNVQDIVHDLRDIGDHMIKVAAEYGVTLTVDDVTDPDESEQGTQLD